MRIQVRVSRHAKETSETLKRVLFHRMFPLWLIVYSNPARFIDKPKVLLCLNVPIHTTTITKSLMHICMRSCRKQVWRIRACGVWWSRERGCNSQTEKERAVRF